tara:strand:+ start:359 stop:514 length:156 start_codon:yes stop_codon:yes gene_type:complete
MAHHYQDFFISYDWRIPKKKLEKEKASETKEVEKNEQEEELKEAKCSNMTK